MSRVRRRRGERGFVLLIVLWTLPLLALIGTNLLTRAHGQASLALATRDAVILEAAADGGINAAIFHVLDQAGQDDGLPHESMFGPIRLTTTISNQAGKVNPNNAPEVLLRALLHVVGMDQQAADELVSAMLMWRTRREAALPIYQRAGRAYGPSGAPFQTIDEIGLVLGMTPDVLARLAPHLSLFQQGDVNIRYADPVVAEALDEAGTAAAPLAALRVKVDDTLLRVTVRAETTGGRSCQRSAEIRFFTDPAAGAPKYAVLSWQSD